MPDSFSHFILELTGTLWMCAALIFPFALLLAVIPWAILSLSRYLRARKDNKIHPGSVSREKLRRLFAQIFHPFFFAAAALVALILVAVVMDLITQGAWSRMIE